MAKLHMPRNTRQTWCGRDVRKMRITYAPTQATCRTCIKADAAEDRKQLRVVAVSPVRARPPKAGTHRIPSMSNTNPSSPPQFTTERYDRDCTRIIDGDGNVVALIGALSNGLWSVFDTHDKQPTKRSFPTVRLAFKWWLTKDQS